MKQPTISQSANSDRAGTERRIDLDWVRIAAFGLLIFYHVGMLYVSWGFHIKSAHRITALEPLMLVLNPWRLSLLFLVSGVATRFMLRKYALVPAAPVAIGAPVDPAGLRHGRDCAAAGLRPDRRGKRLSRRILGFLSPSLLGFRPAVLPQALHPAADLEPSLVRRLSLGLYDGARGRADGASRIDRAGRARRRSHSVGPAAADRAVCPVRRLSPHVCCRASLRRTRCSAIGTITPCSPPSSCSVSCSPT